MVLRIANTNHATTCTETTIWIWHKNCNIVVCSVWYTSIPHTTHYRHYEYPADVVGTFNFLLRKRLYIHRGILVA